MRALNMTARHALKYTARSTLMIVAAAWLLASCNFPQPVAYNIDAQTCAQARLNAAQLLYQAAQSSLVQHYKERSPASLSAAYNFAGDAITVARSIRGCPDFNARTRAIATNLMRSNTQLRAMAVATMRDPDAIVPQTLLQEQYGDVFGGRDIE
jgi:hypothetical protein